ncbi:MAG: hypothetical protein COT43_04245 [Candidatus Marinimicrobia bacterium CG08_land_8_20_14_0_20_45_22]|nr:MAG: hypothetical protein COT43_04245 [Candidatus Marinimicrobia bacterium CG08_land_8_20_14_0_20_45_22]
MALAAAIYLSLMGKTGLKQAATLCLNNSHYLAEKISSLKGFSLPYGNVPFFKEFVVETPVSPKEIITAGLAENFFAGIDLGNYREDWKGHLLMAVTEKRTRKEIEFFVKFLSKF